MNDAAASIGFRLKLDRNNLPTDAGFAYELAPLAPGQQPVTPNTLHSFFSHASSGLGAIYRGIEEFFSPRRQVNR